MSQVIMYQKISPFKELENFSNLWLAKLIQTIFSLYYLQPAFLLKPSHSARNKTKPNTNSPQSIFPILHYTAYYQVPKHLESSQINKFINDTIYTEFNSSYVNEESTSHDSPIVSKGKSFKNEWDTCLVLYKNCTQAKEEKLHRNKLKPLNLVT